MKKQETRIEKIETHTGGHLFCVMVKSPVHGRYIAQSEVRTLKEALKIEKEFHK